MENHWTDKHRFVRRKEDDDGSLESKLARQYYLNLDKKFVVVDVRYYKEFKIGMRWRTKFEASIGKGEKICGNIVCSEDNMLSPHNLDFRYSEDNTTKQTTVKCNLCEECSFKVQYKQLTEMKQRSCRGNSRHSKHRERSRSRSKSPPRSTMQFNR